RAWIYSVGRALTRPAEFPAVDGRSGDRPSPAGQNGAALVRKLGTVLALTLSLGTIFSVSAHGTTPLGWAALSAIPAGPSDTTPPASGGTFGACVDGNPDGDDLYLAYGYDGPTAKDTLAFRIYDHDANKWRQGPDAPGPARHFVAGAFHSGKLYCIGGGSDI